MLEKDVVEMKALEFARGTNFILPQDMYFFSLTLFFSSIYYYLIMCISVIHQIVFVIRQATD